MIPSPMERNEYVSRKSLIPSVSFWFRSRSRFHFNGDEHPVLLERQINLSAAMTFPMLYSKGRLYR